MTEPDAAGDLASLGGLPTVVLDDRGLDLLELVLGGALAALPPLPGVPAMGGAVLVDRENTPLARIADTAEAGRDRRRWSWSRCGRSHVAAARSGTPHSAVPPRRSAEPSGRSPAIGT